MKHHDISTKKLFDLLRHSEYTLPYRNATPNHGASRRIIESRRHHARDHPTTRRSLLTTFEVVVASVGLFAPGDGTARVMLLVLIGMLISAAIAGVNRDA